jgi:hypothetical protein
MSMSDDDEDYEEEEEEEEDGDDNVGLPLEESQSDYGDLEHLIRLATMLDDDGSAVPTHISRHESRKTLPVVSLPPRSKRSMSSKRKTTAVAESWFPLASFTDDESSWNWRSFIEIASIS